MVSPKADWYAVIAELSKYGFIAQNRPGPLLHRPLYAYVKLIWYAIIAE